MSDAAAKSCSYQRRRPELTPCYEIIAEHLSTFACEREAEQRPLPDYVLKEFEAYFKCGILAHGFIRLKCSACSEETVVAFSCKKRGFCPSCCAKRMAEAATHLTQKCTATGALPAVRGYLNKDGDIVVNPALDPLFQDHESLTAALAASIGGKIAFGPNAGNYVRKIGGGFGYEGEVPLAIGKRCYSVNGFSLHANTAINTHARDRLYKLIEYIARGPLSNDRLEILANGDVKLALKTPWANGTTHLVFTPSEFIEKLVALIPPPRSHLVR